MAGFGFDAQVAEALARSIDFAVLVRAQLFHAWAHDLPQETMPAAAITQRLAQLKTRLAGFKGGSPSCRGPGA